MTTMPTIIKSLLFSLALSAAATFPSAGVAADPEAGGVVREKPIPDFVIERTLPRSWSDLPHHQSGIRTILIDFQHEVADDSQRLYTRIVSEAISDVGAASLSYVQIPVFPAYQSLEINRISVRRNNLFEDRAGRFHASLSTPENLASAGVITGMNIAVIRLDDIRAGDLVDFSYTVRDSSAFFGTRRTHAFPSALSTYVAQYSVRSIWPGDVTTSVPPPNVNFRREKENGKSVITIGPMRLDAVDLSQTPSLASATGSSLMVSSFGNWAEVAEWGRGHYVVKDQEAVRDLVSQITAGAQTIDEKTVKIIRFVQDEIRYSAVLLGEGGYEPADARATLKTRFGDCKAKSQLLLTMLDSIGVRSVAALVNLEDGFNIQRYAPTPAAFNHVIVRFEINGREYWVDPTSSKERGDLNSMTQADYGFALPLEAGASAPISMAASTGGLTSVEVKESFELSAGAAPANVMLTAALRGPAADDLRRIYENLGEDGFFNTMVQIYGRYGATKVLKRSYSDNQNLNEISVSLKASISSPFGLADEEGKRHFGHDPWSLSAPVPDYGEETPIGPVQVLVRQKVVHTLEISLPARISWKLKPKHDQIDSSAFRFTSSVVQSGDKLVQTSILEPLGRLVAPGDYSAVLEAQGKMLDKRGYDIWIRGGSGPNRISETLPLEKPELDIPIVPPGEEDLQN